MAKFDLPEEPEGPVWDRVGREWNRLLSDEGWVFGMVELQWHELLDLHGPLTDTPPVNVGDVGTYLKLMRESLTAQYDTNALCAKAWDEGFNQGVNYDMGDRENAPEVIRNPYRKGEEA